MATRDPGEIAADAATDFFHQIYTFFETIILRFVKNFYASFADVSVNRWTKVVCSVVGYIIARPYIEALFRKMGERDRRRQQEKERKKRAEAEAGGKAKVSANALRGGKAAAEGGKVLGEVENTDDELEQEGEGEGADEVDFATASGVPEFADNARRRQKKHAKSLEKDAKAQKTKLSEDQLMELLDWSDSEDENKGGAAKGE